MSMQISDCSGDFDLPRINGDFILKDFKFASGEILPEARMHYVTLGAPHRDAAGEIDNAVMLLHTTGGSSGQFLSPEMVNSLFAPGKPLDVLRYYVIIPESVGHGKSSKPSDGLRTRFPAYDYVDMVGAQRQLLIEGLGVNCLELLLGVSMGGMHCFIWGTTYPKFARAIMPMVCFPVAIAGLNRVHRKLMADGIRSDPAWLYGNYARQPELGLRIAASLTAMVVDNPLALMSELPTPEDADRWAGNFVNNFVSQADANDFLYQIEASRNYDALVGLEKMTAPVTWVNFEDDLMNPAVLGIGAALIGRMPQGRFVEVPQTLETRGHFTWMTPKHWIDELIDLIERSSNR